MPTWNVEITTRQVWRQIEANTQEAALELAEGGELMGDEDEYDAIAYEVSDEEPEAAEDAPWQPVPSTSYSPQMMQHLQDQKKLRVVRP
jgi:hypothetical protein